MSQTTSTAAASSRFQDIFNAALKSYQKQTKKDLIAHPLASRLQSCDSTSAILAVLQDQIREFDQAHSGYERLTKWLFPTVNVLYAFSAAVSEGVGLVFSPAKVIFAGISAAKDVAASKDTLAELFECIGFFFNRLGTYTEVTPTAAMTNIITKIMVEVLAIFGIATKELRRGSAKKLLNKLAGRTDLEDAVKKLDRLTGEEARIALAEVLKMTHIVHDDVKVVDGKVESIDDKVEDIGGKVEDIGDKVDDIGDKVDHVGGKVENIGDRVQCVDEKVKVVIDDGKEARLVVAEAKSIIQQTANSVDEIKWNQIKQLLRAWLSPADPSTNHNIAQKAQHKGTAVWFFQGNVFIEWKSSGSLLWVHGKPGSGKSVICSSVIQDITAVCESGSAIIAYFYFDFRDLTKQTCHDLLLSLVFQLSTRSGPCCDILHHVYKTHEDGTRQPSDDTLKECLKEMLRLLAQGPTFIVLDALDECPNSPGIPSPPVMKSSNSRPEVDIRAVLHPLASRSVSLQNESGQTSDIADYIQSVVNSSPSTAMRRWRADDRNLVIETLTERADGMFRWVFCQLDTLQHCFPPNLRQFLNELPETLDETYERILKGINKAQKDNTHRLLQCLQWCWVVLAPASLILQATCEVDIRQIPNIGELVPNIPFHIEIAMRIVTHPPDWHSFFVNGNNYFDLVPSIGSTAIQIPTVHDSPAYLLLTTIQLTRFYRVILGILRLILLSVFGNTDGLTNIPPFLILVNYLAALFASQLLCGDLRDSAHLVLDYLPDLLF
ncbi:hypothetical protein H4582DRAFT_2086559 [Lactarius indigo]|nr:hypothetical protein H4582DRAFT_2086559 [Lactarius indigo]